MFMFMFIVLLLYGAFSVHFVFVCLMHFMYLILCAAIWRNKR